MAADLASPFPNPEQGPRVVLYPLTAGGVALEWRLTSTLIESALSAFPANQAIAKVYLRRLDGSGASAAEAVLDDQWATRATGSARFERPVVGALRAELGLEGRHNGAWLLLARSNRLDSVPQTTPIAVELGGLRAASLPDYGHADRDSEVTAISGLPNRSAMPTPEVSPKHPLQPGPAQSQYVQSQPAQSEPAQPRPAQSEPPQPHPAQPPAVRLLSPRSMLAGEPSPAPPQPPRFAAEPRPPTTEQAVPAARAPQTWAGQDVEVTTGRVGEASTVQGGEGAAVSTPASQPLTGLTGEGATQGPRPKMPRNPSRFPDPSLATAAPGSLSHGRVFPIAASAGTSTAPMPEAENGSMLTSLSAPSSEAKMDRGPAKRQDPPEPEPSVPHASGPLAPYPTQEAACIRGQLRVFGSAPPGSLLDLGGHRFRVGPGGRFAFTVDLDDPELLASLLRRLPRLPVAERDP